MMQCLWIVYELGVLRLMKVGQVFEVVQEGLGGEY